MMNKAKNVKKIRLGMVYDTKLNGYKKNLCIKFRKTRSALTY